VEAGRLHELSSGASSSSSYFEPLGGRLSDEEQAVLTTLMLCTLAVEARSNHLIAELVEQGKLTEDEGRGAERLPPREKWCLLPKLAGRRRRIDLSRQPHQAVAEICATRNALVHVNFDRLKVPTSNKMLSLYSGFAKAMEDMNVVMGRVRKERKYVSRISTF